MIKSLFNWRIYIPVYTLYIWFHFCATKALRVLLLWIRDLCYLCEVCICVSRMIRVNMLKNNLDNSEWSVHNAKHITIFYINGHNFTLKFKKIFYISVKILKEHKYQSIKSKCDISGGCQTQFFNCFPIWSTHTTLWYITAISELYGHLLNLFTLCFVRSALYGVKLP